MSLEEHFIPESIQGLVGQSLGKPGIVEGVSAHSKGWKEMSFKVPSQPSESGILEFWHDHGWRFGTAKSQLQDSSREEDGGCKMRCLKLCGLGLCQIRKNPKSSSAPWNDSDSDCFCQSIPNSKQQGKCHLRDKWFSESLQGFFKYR